jgi:hypothetical protein
MSGDLRRRHTRLAETNCQFKNLRLPQPPWRWCSVHQASSAPGGRNRDCSQLRNNAILGRAAHTPSSATLESIPTRPGPPPCLALDPTTRPSNPHPAPSGSTRKTLEAGIGCNGRVDGSTDAFQHLDGCKSGKGMLHSSRSRTLHCRGSSSEACARWAISRV